MSVLLQILATATDIQNSKQTVRHSQKSIESRIPVQLREQNFTIASSEIKLDKDFMASTIEIEKFEVDRSKKMGLGDLSELYDIDDDEAALVTLDQSYVVRHEEKPSKPIEFFKG